MDCQVVVALRCAFSVPSGGDVTMMGMRVVERSMMKVN